MLFAFFLRPRISLLAIGTVSGFGIVMPDVSDSAVTSIAEGGAMLYFDLVDGAAFEKW